MKASSVKVWTSIFAMLLCTQSVSAYSLKGTVYDSSTNAALSGVIVYHKATAKRVITGASGVFSLTIGGSAGANRSSPFWHETRNNCRRFPLEPIRWSLHGPDLSNKSWPYRCATPIS